MIGSGNAAGLFGEWLSWFPLSPALFGLIPWTLLLFSLHSPTIPAARYIPTLRPHSVTTTSLMFGMQENYRIVVGQ